MTLFHIKFLDGMRSWARTKIPSSKPFFLHEVLGAWMTRVCKVTLSGSQWHNVQKCSHPPGEQETGNKMSEKCNSWIPARPRKCFNKNKQGYLINAFLNYQAGMMHSENHMENASGQWINIPHDIQCLPISTAASCLFQTFRKCRETGSSCPGRWRQWRRWRNILKVTDLGSFFSYSPVSPTVSAFSRVWCKIFFSVWDLESQSFALGLYWLVQNCPKQ